MTIDAPMLACWSLATLGIVIWWQRTVDREWALQWALMVGLCIGLGALYKYTALLLLPGVLLAILLDIGPRSPGERESASAIGAKSVAHRRLVGFACAAGAAALALWPTVTWNMQRGWPTVLLLGVALGLGQLTKGPVGLSG